MSDPWLILLFVSFLLPLLEAVLILIGTIYAELRYKKAPEKFSLMIIQITTVGREPELVQRAVDTIRSYNLKMPYEIWVVLEPDMFTDYQNVDHVIVTPADFVCNPVDKARALEYSRRVRVERGLNREDVKIVFMDDDSLPSKKYLESAFAGDYDICQGITIPNRWYAIGGWQHFLLSHLDDPRSRNCLIYCSTTQGILGKPIYVHGEGLTITGKCEDIIKWDFHIVGSDDLVFGTNAAHQGLRWGYHNRAIQIVSPWTFQEHLTQRWRWTWGNIDAIRNRKVMPLNYSAAVLFKYLIGYITTFGSFTGIALLATGAVELPRTVQIIFIASFALWLITYAIPGFISSGGQPNRQLRPNPIKYWGFKIVQTILAVLMIPMSAFAPMLVITYCVLRGRPERFVVIAKSNASMGL